jgi:DNA mismatch repair ATPase MutS
VANDLTVGPRGTILLVTGSNMAGKTTLLRAIALNVILAQAGAPVCARSLTLSRFRLRTSMRATDSLEEGLSLFMAELVRLKSIVDEARVDADCALLYLADEILRGTNAADRHAAIITVLETLAATGAVGVVATHDPDIAAAPSLAPRIHAVNLIEQFRSDSTGHPAMWFDYKLRPGVATTRNALKLLEMVGLDARP